MKKMQTLLAVVLGTVVGWLTDWLLFRRTLESETGTLRNELKIAQGQAKDMERKAEAHSAEITTLREKLTAAQASDDVTTMKSELNAANKEVASLKRDLKYAARKVTLLQQELDAKSTELEDLRTQLDVAQTDVQDVTMDNTLLIEVADVEDIAIEMPHTDVVMEEASTSAAHVTGEPEDLERIEGIGPKTKQVLLENGVLTFAHLASGTPEELAALLKEGGFKGVAHTQTWPEQAALASEGRWDELKRLQDTLVAGRRPS